MNQSVFFNDIVIDFQIFKHVNELPNNWNAIAYHDLFLQTTYLDALEKASPNNITLYYIGFYSNSELIGITIVQRVELYLNDIFRNHNDTCFKERFKNLISKVLKGNILVAGNITHTGQHGVNFNTTNYSTTDFINALLQALLELKKDIKTQYNKTIRAYLMKDYFIDDPITSHSDVLETFGFHKLAVQPNMILDVKPHWNTFDDYISELNKKYRDRYKTARKKARQVLKKELHTQDIEAHSKQLYTLYKNVSDHAKINTFILPENHFLEFKLHLEKAFRVYAYYLDNQIVGFYTLILNSDNLETYFLGYNPKYQYQHQLYLNMLYDMLLFAIDNQLKTVVYARTAMAIKSSVGAKPKRMIMYLKHTNWVMNTLLKAIFKLMNPKQDWEERHPFK
ncbi:GNAT family N-acetyltransferase [Hanstruepera marina]|uniref:GNAT family N-acetyltransferase n=1 Tax=Hanstruepera marina TaxID=2873265 RepID=UPI002105A9A6|nr:GNAT family N-acetyltransferase [Hanstruepera marina]